MRRWKSWTNRLGFRLFALLWAALILAHYVGYAISQGLSHDQAWSHSGPPGAPAGLPHLSALPPTDGLSPPGPPRGMGGPSLDEPGPGDEGPGGKGPSDQPWLAAIGDYGVRMLVFALAAWVGSRWVSRPLRRLTGTAEQLDAAIAAGRQVPTLDERDGPQEMRDTARVFNDMARRLGAQFEERSMMMAAVSHDIRTPLTRLCLRLEYIDQPTVREAQRTDVAEIDLLVSQLLDALSQERAQAPLCRVDLGSLVQAVVDDLQETGGAIELKAIERPCAVMAEPQALRRVMDNLMGNALRHGHRATVSLHEAGAHVDVRIDDEGPGIPEQHLAQVFKPFYRVDASRGRQTGGTGLGLYIARQLAARQGAEIVLSNRPEGGLRASVRWPVAPPA